MRLFSVEFSLNLRRAFESLEPLHLYPGILLLSFFFFSFLFFALLLPSISPYKIISTFRGLSDEARYNDAWWPRLIRKINYFAGLLINFTITLLSRTHLYVYLAFIHHVDQDIYKFKGWDILFYFYLCLYYIYVYNFFFLFPHADDQKEGRNVGEKKDTRGMRIQKISLPARVNWLHRYTAISSLLYNDVSRVINVNVAQRETERE